MTNIHVPGRSRVEDLIERAARVELFLTDVDGVLTAGEVLSDGDGVPLKIFDVKDGMGLYLLGKAGIRRGVITGKTSAAVAARCAELGLDYCRQGVGDKGRELGGILAETSLTARSLAYVGDDLNDLAPLRAAGLACCPADAAADVIERCHYVCAARGGGGAVREVAELVLKARGLWEGFLEAWTEGAV